MTTVNILNGLEFLYPTNLTISQLKRTIENYPESQFYFADAFSLGQLQSKMWMIEHLPKNLGLVWIAAGWYGTLAHLMFEKIRDSFDKIRSFDIDPTCADIAETYNRHWVVNNWQFKATTLNILDMDYPCIYTTYRKDRTSVQLTELPNTIINTSCEHIIDFDKWYSKIPDGKIVALQSNNYFSIPEHVNCVNNISEFTSQTLMKTEIFSGELKFKDYTRFMRIGYK